MAQAHHSTPLRPPVQTAFVHPADAAATEASLRRRRAAKRANIAIPPLNITSFLDMSFCLLTFLILSVDSTLGEGVLTSNLPGDASSAVIAPTDTPPPASDAPQFVIIIGVVDRTRCRIEVENYPDRPASFTALTTMLQRLGANAKGETDPDARVIIQPEAGVRLGPRAQCLQCRRAGQVQEHCFYRAKVSTLCAAFGAPVPSQ